MSEIKWIKICTDIFDDEKMLLIDAMPERDAIIVIWFKLLCMAGKQNNDGVFMLNDKIAYNDEMLSNVFRRPLTTVRLALSTFEQFGMVQLIEDAITIPNWGKYQNIARMNEIREASRVRMAASRARKKLASGETTANKRDQVRMYAAEHPDATNAGIAKALGMSRTTVIKHLKGDAVPALPHARDGQPTGVQVNTRAVQLDTELDVHGVQLDSVQGVQMDVQLDTALNTQSGSKTDITAGQGCTENVTRNIGATCANVTAPDTDKDREKEKDKEQYGTGSRTVRGGDGSASRAPSIEEVRDFFRKEGIVISPDYFFDYFDGRGWLTAQNEPVRNWKGLALSWDKADRARESSRPLPERQPSTATREAPSIERMMKEYSVTEEEARLMLSKGLF